MQATGNALPVVSSPRAALEAKDVKDLETRYLPGPTEVAMDYWWLRNSRSGHRLRKRQSKPFRNVNTGPHSA